MNEVPWVQTLAGAAVGALVPIAGYWFTREGGQRPRLESEAQRFAFDALQQVAETRGGEIDRLSRMVDALMGEVKVLRGEVEDCQRKHSNAQAALASAGIVIDD